MNAKHTLGSWGVGDSGMVYADHPKLDAVEVALPIGLSDDERTANAALIAAAPDLLAALEQVLIASEDGGDMEDIDFEGIRAAIAKARA